MRRRRSARTLRWGSATGTVVDMRTFMYDVRKQLKMKVSLSRKIHIIALPHGTGKACLSADQSAVDARQACGTAQVDRVDIMRMPS